MTTCQGCEMLNGSLKMSVTCSTEAVCSFYEQTALWSSSWLKHKKMWPMYLMFRPPYSVSLIIIQDGEADLLSGKKMVLAASSVGEI